MNDLDVVRLEEHLFGSKRVSLDPVTSDLCLLHDHRCFYCDAALGDVTGKRVQIDHFIPWARHPDNAIENLVPAHERCNSQKRDFLAAGGHVQRWRDRAERRASDLRLIAERARFEHDPERVLSVARGIYLRLPARALLWVRGTEFEAVGSEGIGRLLVPPPEAGAG